MQPREYDLWCTALVLAPRVMLLPGHRLFLQHRSGSRQPSLNQGFRNESFTHSANKIASF